MSHYMASCKKTLKSWMGVNREWNFLYINLKISFREIVQLLHVINWQLKRRVCLQTWSKIISLPLTCPPHVLSCPPPSILATICLSKKEGTDWVQNIFWSNQSLINLKKNIARVWKPFGPFGAAWWSWWWFRSFKVAVSRLLIYPVS